MPKKYIKISCDSPFKLIQRKAMSVMMTSKILTRGGIQEMIELRWDSRDQENYVGFLPDFIHTHKQEKAEKVWYRAG